MAHFASLQEIQRLSHDIAREEERLSQTTSTLKDQIQRLKAEVSENQDDLESLQHQRDSTRRDMER